MITPADAFSHIMRAKVAENNNGRVLAKLAEMEPETRAAFDAWWEDGNAGFLVTEADIDAFLHDECGLCQHRNKLYPLSSLQEVFDGYFIHEDENPDTDYLADEAFDDVADMMFSYRQAIGY